MNEGEKMIDLSILWFFPTHETHEYVRRRGEEDDKVRSSCGVVGCISRRGEKKNGGAE